MSISRRSPATCQNGYGTLLLVPEMPTSTSRNGPRLVYVKDETGEIPATQFSAVDDATLVEACLQCQEWAESEVWYRFAPMVYTFFRRALGSQHDAEDLLQEVFARVFARLSTLQDPTALRSFIYSFGVRVLSQELRRDRIRSRLTSLFLAPFLKSSSDHVDFESRDLLRRIQAVLDRMRPRQRAVFVLRRFEGLELTQVALSLNLSLATVKRDMDKAKTAIAELIRGDDSLRSLLEDDIAPKRKEERLR